MNELYETVGNPKLD